VALSCGDLGQWPLSFVLRWVARRKYRGTYLGKKWKAVPCERKYILCKTGRKFADFSLKFLKCNMLDNPITLPFYYNIMYHAVS